MFIRGAALLLLIALLQLVLCAEDYYNVQHPAPITRSLSLTFDSSWELANKPTIRK